jgi:putative ABC transport system permease protein
MSSASILVQLVLAHHAKRRARALLGVLGIALSVFLVIYVIRGYDRTLRGPSRPDAGRMQAERFDVAVAPPMPMMMPGGRRGEGPRRPPPGGEAPRYVETKLIEELRKDPAVAEVMAVARMRVRVVSPQPVRPMGPFGGGTMIGTADSAPPKALGEGRWIEAGKESEAVVSAGFAERYGLKLDDALTLGGSGSEMALKVVGVIGAREGGGGGMPRMPMPPSNSADIYVGVATADKINGFSGRHNLVCLVLKDKDGATDFVDLWSAKTQGNEIPVSFRALRQRAGEAMDARMAGMVQMQAANATILAFMAACFIIFATLSGGVRERLREFASLRAIALSRSQLAVMIFFEALLVAAVGWVVGLLVVKGWGLAIGFSSGTDSELGWMSIWTSFGCALVGSLAAAVLPVWQATRLKPVDILGGSGETAVRTFRWRPFVTGLALAAPSLLVLLAGWASPIGGLAGKCIEIAMSIVACAGAALLIIPLMRRFPRSMSVVGLVLLSANPIAILLADIEPFYSIFSRISRVGFGPPILACVAMIVGLGMLTPGFIRLIEAVCGPVMASLLGLNRSFLRQQLSGNLWRTVGTTISLSAGLAFFVTAMVWGYSMLVPFMPDTSLPRALVSVLPAGVPDDGDSVKKVQDAIDKEVRDKGGVVRDEFLAMAVEQPRIARASIESKPFASVDPAQEHLLMMGVDPARAFGGARPVLGFTFIQGDRETAARKLATGRCCLVPDHFHTQTGLNLGDTFSLEVPNAPGQTVEYEIAGVVSVPGWNWFTKFADIRRRAGRALAMVFADVGRVKEDFKIDRICYFWTNVDEKVRGEDIAKRLEPLADTCLGEHGVRIDVPGVGPTLVSKQYVKTTLREDIIERITRRAEGVFSDLKKLPLGALVIASLALFNTVFASVRARYWQFGVLRGVGLSRGQLFRLVISESLMIFLAAGILSLGSGLLLGWTGTRFCTIFFFFAGRTPPLTVPWGEMAVGFGIAFGLCFLAGLLPAWRAARKEPLGFIQEGRLAL